MQPNLQPPITTTDQAITYKKELQSIDPSVEYLMTLSLTPSLTPQEIRKAKNAGIIGQFLNYHLRSSNNWKTSTGVKSYPRGVTTNSEHGIEHYEDYYPVFEAMESEGLVLNLHGEMPSNPSTVSHNHGRIATFIDTNKEHLCFEC
jgi:dihydroorotase